MAKPSIIPVWAIGPTAKKTKPTTTQEDVGYVPKEYPTHAQFNYLFNAYYQWIVYISNELSVEVSDSLTITEDFTFLTESEFNAISSPTSDDKINRKVSEAVELVRSEKAFGEISGCSIETNDTSVSVNPGVIKVYQQSVTSWGTTGNISVNVPSLSNLPVVNASLTDWQFFGAGGIMANGVTSFASAVSVHFFILTDGANVFVLADTSRSGVNAVTTLSNVNSINPTNIYKRRIGSTMTRASSGNTKILRVRSYDDRFFLLKPTDSDVQAYSSYIVVDSLGLIVPATAPLLPGVTTTTIDLNLSMAPSLNDKIYHCAVRYGGTAANTHDVIIDINDFNGTRYNYSNYHQLAAVLDSGYVKNVTYESFDSTVNSFFAINGSTTATTNGDITYLEIICHGWTDYREKNVIG